MQQVCQSYAGKGKGRRPIDRAVYWNWGKNYAVEQFPWSGNNSPNLLAETSPGGFPASLGAHHLAWCRILFAGTRPKGRLRSAVDCHCLEAWIDADYCKQLGNL